MCTVRYWRMTDDNILSSVFFNAKTIICLFLFTLFSTSTEIYVLKSRHDDHESGTTMTGGDVPLTCLRENAIVCTDPWISLRLLCFVHSFNTVRNVLDDNILMSCSKVTVAFACLFQNGILGFLLMTDYYGAFSHIYMQFSGPDTVS